MTSAISEIIEVLSAELAQLSIEKTTQAHLDTLQSIAERRLNATESDLHSDLTTSIKDRLTAEIGCILSLREVSPDEFKAVKQEIDQKILDETLDVVGFHYKTLRKLLEGGYHTLGDIVNAHPVDILDFPGFGVDSRERLALYLHDRGVEWTPTVGLVETRTRRIARLDEYSLRELSVGIKRDSNRLWEINVLTPREINEYLLTRLSKATDEELGDFHLNAFLKLFPVYAQRELTRLGILRYKDLLTLDEEAIRMRCSENKIKEPTRLIECINKSLAKIGRSIKVLSAHEKVKKGI